MAPTTRGSRRQTLWSRAIHSSGPVRANGVMPLGQREAGHLGRVLGPLVLEHGIEHPDHEQASKCPPGQPQQYQPDREGVDGPAEG